jgi:hypothetical protein
MPDIINRTAAQSEKLADLGDETYGPVTVPRVVAYPNSNPYRINVTAPDLAAGPAAVTCTAQAGGSLVPAQAYNIKVVAVFPQGRTTPVAGDAAVNTAGGNLTARVAFATVTGAVGYDIYCSTDPDPKWVGYITEAQRVTGIKITAVGVTGAGGTAGAVDVEVAGTGLQAGTTAAQGTAYVMPDCDPVDTKGKQYVDFDLVYSRTGDAVAPALTVVPFFLASTATGYFAGAPESLTFGGTAGAYDALRQRLRVECRGAAGVHLVVAAIAGTGASLDVYASTS